MVAPWRIDADGRLLNASRSLGESKFAREMFESSHCIKIVTHIFGTFKLTSEDKRLPEETVDMQANQTSNPSCLERTMTQQCNQDPAKFVVDNNQEDARPGTIKTERAAFSSSILVEIIYDPYRE